MDNSRYLACLEADYRRMREVAGGHLGARVPTCPDWTVADLTRHVGQVYLHKVECMRTGGEVETDWPPAGLQDEEPVALLDRSYAALVRELTTRDPSDPGGTWYEPDPTVGFWVRRMAQESVIHRIDAELGAGATIAPVPDDLAADGVDELLKVFVAYSFSKWPEDFSEALQDSPGHAFLIRAEAAATAESPSGSWLVKTGPDHLVVEGGQGSSVVDSRAPDVTVSGTPADVLRWAWNRETPGAASLVRVEGNTEALTELRRCVVEATQ
jgi:uncharacterized protein (TIGR03083 family)